MAYTVTNFKTKKALKEAVKYWKDCPRDSFGVELDKTIAPVRCYQPGLGPDLSSYTGKIALEGPHYPKPHTWYAEAWLENGIVVKVK